MRPGPLAALTVGLALVRLWLSARTGLGDDEAYYWHWSTALDLSYREHPPLVAWVIAAGCRVAGENPLGVRLGFVLSGLWASYLTWRVAETEQPGTGWLASLLVSLVPMFAIMAVFAAPDMPMLCGWLLAWRGLQRDRWLWVGLGMGLALLGKLTGGLLVVGVLLAVVRRRPDQLRQWGLWAALGLALVMNLPSLWWALDHGGGTFTYQLVERHRHRVLPWVGAGQLVGSQLLLVGPAVVAMLAALRRPGMHRELALPTLVLFSLAALVTDSKIHWLAPSWLLLAPGAAAWLAPRPRWTAVSLGTAGLLTALVYTQSQVSVVPLDPRADPTVEMRGWHDVAAHAVEMRDQCGIPDAPIAGHMYQTTGQLRWAVPRDIPVVRAGTRPDQYATWQTAGPYVGGPAVFVAPERYRVSPLKEGFFDTCEATEEHRFNGRLFLVTCCKGLRADGLDGSPSRAVPAQLK